jgi:hypothetical protein
MDLWVLQTSFLLLDKVVADDINIDERCQVTRGSEYDEGTEPWFLAQKCFFWIMHLFVISL